MQKNDEPSKKLKKCVNEDNNNDNDKIGIELVVIKCDKI